MLISCQMQTLEGKMREIEPGLVYRSRSNIDWDAV